MKIEELHYELMRKWQMHNSYRDGLTDVEKDAVLNNAVDFFFERYVFGRPGKATPIGAEQSMQRSDMLSTLLVSSTISPGAMNGDGSYSFSLPSNYRSMREAFLDATCGKMTVRVYGHDKMMDVMRNKHRSPSKKFMRAAAFRRGNDLNVFLPAGEIAGNMTIYYYRKPARIALGTYPEIPDVGGLPGANIPKTECDIPEQYHPWIVDIAVQELASIYGDVNRLNIQSSKILELS
jgi:hypothetical protein